MTNPLRNLVLGLAATLLSASACYAAATPDWTLKVRQLLASKQSYPAAAQMRGDEGTAKIKLEITTDGSIAAVSLVEPSGSAVLDREALAVAKRVGSFPLPPGGSASLVVPLTWKLN